MVELVKYLMPLVGIVGAIWLLKSMIQDGRKVFDKEKNFFGNIGNALSYASVIAILGGFLTVVGIWLYADVYYPVARDNIQKSEAYSDTEDALLDVAERIDNGWASVKGFFGGSSSGTATPEPGTQGGQPSQPGDPQTGPAPAPTPYEVCEYVIKTVYEVRYPAWASIFKARGLEAVNNGSRDMFPSGGGNNCTIVNTTRMGSLKMKNERFQITCHEEVSHPEWGRGSVVVNGHFAESIGLRKIGTQVFSGEGLWPEEMFDRVCVMVTPEPTPVPTATPVPAPTSTDQPAQVSWKTIVHDLQCRIGPGTNYRAKGSIPLGTILTLRTPAAGEPSQTGNWRPVMWGSTTCWSNVGTRYARRQ